MDKQLQGDLSLLLSRLKKRIDKGIPPTFEFSTDLSKLLILASKDETEGGSNGDVPEDEPFIPKGKITWQTQPEDTLPFEKKGK